MCTNTFSKFILLYLSNAMQIFQTNSKFSNFLPLINAYLMQSGKKKRAPLRVTRLFVQIVADHLHRCCHCSCLHWDTNTLALQLLPSNHCTNFALVLLFIVLYLCIFYLTYLLLLLLLTYSPTPQHFVSQFAYFQSTHTHMCAYICDSTTLHHFAVTNLLRS